jgi:hypothetical protein
MGGGRQSSTARALGQELTDDTALHAIRGELVVIANHRHRYLLQRRPPGDSPHLTYYYYLPHGDTVVPGGVALVGISAQNRTPQVSASTSARCAEVQPLLGDAQALEHRVGHRATHPEFVSRSSRWSARHSSTTTAMAAPDIPIEGCPQAVLRRGSRIDSDLRPRGGAVADTSRCAGRPVELPEHRGPRVRTDSAPC